MSGSWLRNGDLSQSGAPCFHGFGEIADQLADNGFDRCVPAFGKQCAAGWGRWQHEPVPETQRARWIRTHRGASTALIMGGDYCALDLDHPEAEKAFPIREMADNTIGPSSVWRVGQPHKSLRLYRKGEGDLRTFTDRNLDVGFYATTGLVMLYGPHPSGTAYTWPEESPLDVPLEELPELHEEELTAFLRAVREFLPPKDVPIATGGGRMGVMGDAWSHHLALRKIKPTIALGESMAHLVGTSPQRHPAMTGAVAVLATYGWSEAQILDAIAAPYLDQFRDEPRQLGARYRKLIDSIDGAYAKGIGCDLTEAMAEVDFERWGIRRS